MLHGVCLSRVLAYQYNSGSRKDLSMSAVLANWGKLRSHISQISVLAWQPSYQQEPALY